MMNTDKEVFEGSNDWVSMTSADLVYSGEITTLGTDQWIEIELQNTFAYQGFGKRKVNSASSDFSFTVPAVCAILYPAAFRLSVDDARFGLKFDFDLPVKIVFTDDDVAAPDERLLLEKLSLTCVDVDFKRAVRVVLYRNDNAFGRPVQFGRTFLELGFKALLVSRKAGRGGG